MKRSVLHIGKWLLRIFAFFTLVFLLFLFIIAFYSPATTNPLKDEKGAPLNNSIAEIIKPVINGIPQRLLIRGKDLSNPVLLHIHGGPGAPDSPFLRTMGIDVEDIFTVCYWDQRGAGGSYSSTMAEEKLTLPQIVADGITVTNLLTEKFRKEKIYIQGHSWGTVVAAHMVNTYPDLYHAYLAIGHVADQMRSEQISFDYTLNEARKNKDSKAIKILERVGRPPYETTKEMVDAVITQRSYLKSYGGAVYHNDPKKYGHWALAKRVLFYEEYSLTDKINFARGALTTLNKLWPVCTNINLFKDIAELKIPVYFFQGINDFQTTTSIAKNYFDSLNAPQKHFFLFEQSGHFPHWEEVDKYKKILVTRVLSRDTIISK